MSSSSIVTKMSSECRQLLNMVYMNHNQDPIASFIPSNLSTNDISELSAVATNNELQKLSRGNGKGNQTICSGMIAFGEIPVVHNDELEITQQLNVGNGFAFQAPSTWVKRTLSDHIRRGTATKVTDIFDHNFTAQQILAEPMKIDLKPDWDPTHKNFLNGQQIDAYYASLKIWSTKGYFCGSMITPLCDPRQITIIIQSGSGVIQSAFGLLRYKAGDLIQIPPHSAFCFYVAKGTNNAVRCIAYYSKEDLLFPDTQLNVSCLNQVPFSPSVVVQCKYSYNESAKYAQRGEYMRVEQANGLYNLYYFAASYTAFNWSKWVHNGPLVHKVSLLDNYERIGTNKGHKDPNIWLILKHAMDKSFGIAFITGTSFVEVGASEEGKITYSPAYFHLNGVHEKGEVVMFGQNELNDGYDARKGFMDGDCLLHAGGVGHGADVDIYKYFINKAIVKYVLEHKNRERFVKQLVNKKKYQRFSAMDQVKKKQRISGYLKKMYAFDFVENKYNDDKNVEFNVMNHINAAIEVILNENIPLDDSKAFQLLGLRFGVGYLLVECRDSPAIPQCEYNSNFRKSTAVSYGTSVFPVIQDANKYIKKLNKMLIKAAL